LHPRLPRVLSLLSLLSLASCDEPEPAPVRVDEARLRAALTLPLTLSVQQREDAAPTAVEGATVTPMRLELATGLSVGAALWVPERPTGAGVVVAHGHFGQGRSAAETQEIAHQLARQGAHVIAIDTPGMEEHDRPDQELHLDAGGAHGRGLLLAAGTNAMALQIALLQVGLDLLEASGATRLGATGASGGGVQAFYLALLDSRVRAVALAAFPPIPREARASGCPCDQIPGFPGPDPGVLSLLGVPSLWLGDGSTGESPVGLGPEARFVATDAPHTYSMQMQAEALAFFDMHLDLLDDAPAARVPLVDLSIPAPPQARAGLAALPLPPSSAWEPAPVARVPFEKTCSGSGPAVLLAGTTLEDTRAVVEAGLQACTVRVIEDGGGFSESIAHETVYADVLAGGLAAAARATGAVGVYAVGAWALPARTVDLPYVVRAPVPTPDALDVVRDPPWVHVPGAWSGVMAATLEGSVAQGDTPVGLATALRDRVSPRH